MHTEKFISIFLFFINMKFFRFEKMGEIGEEQNIMMRYNGTVSNNIRKMIFKNIDSAIIGEEDHGWLKITYFFINDLLKKG